jgi:general secretion pathway protein A
MYRDFFGLRERPFELTPNPRYLVLLDAHREALSNLTYGIASRKGVTLLIGEAGTGKTTLIRTAVERQPERSHVVHLQNPALTRAEFVEMLAARFGLDENARRSKTAMLLQLESLLQERRARGESTVLIVDEAQSIPLELLEEIRLLANIETAQEKLLSVVLAGQPELVPRLNDAALRQLKQRVALRCELRPLTLQETSAYLAGRIRAAGGVGATVFTREAVTLLHERSGGIPRTISVLADNALLSGFALGVKPVTAAVIHEVCADFDMRPRAVRPAEPGRENGAARPAVAPPASAPAAEPAHVLTFEKPVQREPTAGEPPAGEPPAGEQPAGEEPAHADGALFGAIYPKRRKFLFF